MRSTTIPRTFAGVENRNISNLLLSVRKHTCYTAVTPVGRFVRRVTLLSGSVIVVSVFVGPSRISPSVASC